MLVFEVFLASIIANHITSVKFAHVKKAVTIGLIGRNNWVKFICQ